MTAPDRLPIVLVHGAWCDSSVWRKVARRLEAAGHAVTAPDLPGYGANRRPWAEVTLEAYVDTVVAAASAAAGPVLLVGHSLGGLSVSQAAERAPERVAGLVYVSAFMLADGQSRSSVAALDPDSVALRHRVEVGAGLIAFPAERVAEILGTAGSGPTVAGEPPPPQPVAPLQTPLRLSAERYGRVPRFFVKCARDRAITPAFQEAMIRATPVRRVFELDAGHSPALSHAELLAAILVEIAAEVSGS